MFTDIYHREPRMSKGLRTKTMALEAVMGAVKGYI
jgi:hypothetical protein